jgi:hypothetical protein
LREPPDAANNTLVFLSSLKERWIFFVFIRFRARIDREAGPIRDGVGSDVAVMNIIRFHEMRCKTSLTKVDLDHLWSNGPLRMCPQKPFHSPQEINGDVLSEKTFEFGFDRGVR